MVVNGISDQDNTVNVIPNDGGEMEIKGTARGPKD